MMPAVCSIEKDGTYRSGDLIMLSRPIERLLVSLYYRFEANGLLGMIFHEAADKPTLRWFLDKYLAAETSTLIGLRETDGAARDLISFNAGDKCYTPLGMVWINRTWNIGTNFKKAECGMAFVRRTPLEDTLQLGRMSIQWAFDNLGLDALIGCTPSPNRAAVIFGQKIGFQQTTPLEGYSCFNDKLCSVVLQSMTRDRWATVSEISMQEAA